MSGLQEFFVGLCLFVLGALSSIMNAGLPANIHGQTGQRNMPVFTTDMSLGTIAFVDKNKPSDVLLRLTLPRAYVGSHQHIREGGDQLVGIDLIYPGLEPAPIVRRRVLALSNTMPQDEFVERRDALYYRAMLSLELSNDYMNRHRAGQRRRIPACSSAPVASDLVELLPEPAPPARGDCTELLSWRTSANGKLYVLESESKGQLLIECDSSSNKRETTKDCVLDFQFHGFDWRLGFQSARLPEIGTIYREIASFLSKHAA